MVKIGVVSDTHGLLREEVKQVLADCEVILHGGDLDDPKILEKLKEIAPVYAVMGNVDQRWAEKHKGGLDLPDFCRFSYGGLRFFMIHNKDLIKEDISDCDVILYGHSHLYEERRAEGKLWLNPGSCGPKRFFLPVTMAVLEVEEDGSYRVKRIDLSAEGSADKRKEAGKSAEIQAGSHPGKKKISMDKRDLVKAVMKETNRGRDIEWIAARYGISKELAAQICRLYVTHPGIDAEGIINKMG